MKDERPIIRGGWVTRSELRAGTPSPRGARCPASFRFALKKQGYAPGRRTMSFTQRGISNESSMDAFLMSFDTDQNRT